VPFFCHSLATSAATSFFTEGKTSSMVG